MTSIVVARARRIPCIAASGNFVVGGPLVRLVLDVKASLECRAPRTRLRPSTTWRVVASTAIERLEFHDHMPE